MEKDRAEAKLACLGSRLKEKTREIERVNTRNCDHDQPTGSYENNLKQAQKKIAALEDSLAFYRRTVEELTPEVDRLDGIIGRYEAAYGPPPRTTGSDEVAAQE
jgi:hypothetical protein